ncbi:helix-turn-helix domain-containing protein [Rhodococcus sp. IEGM 1330]|uniref:PucR family transcriptional regulator n=1 Tax=Rhodococcus sp. IEGM 1330 TaxID=3082225 RepID=UPI00295504A0|nr:helix-turn-helix domain-containing protein [Rhodococcus sp. IEGM 1330]MDV8022758.1 helix-turn-helix domain-containing protein [Rhodococcus sp. IEGM 1330]
MTEDGDTTREREIAARISSLIDDADVELDSVASRLTDLYRQRIPVYDSVAHEEVQRNTRAVLDIVLWRVRSDSPSVDESDVTDLLRRWSDQTIPLELVAHSIQLGARELFKIIRHKAVEQNLTTAAVDDMQDVMWEWATSYSAAVNTVMQERAVTGAIRRADLIRQLVEGSYRPASLNSDASEHGIDLTHEYRVACVVWDETSKSSDARAMLRMRCSAGLLEVVDAIIDRHLVALLPNVPDRLECSVAIGLGDARTASEARSSYEQAQRALSLAVTFGRTGVVDLAALGPLPLLSFADDVAEQMASVHLDPLLVRGVAGREIMDTVATYLDHDRRVDDTAASLFVHRNTVRNRVARFGDLTGLDIDSTADLVLAWWLLTRDRAQRAALQDPAF